MNASTFQKEINTDRKVKHASLFYQLLLLSELESLDRYQQEKGTTLILLQELDFKKSKVCFPHIFSTHQLSATRLRLQIIITIKKKVSVGEWLKARNREAV